MRATTTQAYALIYKTSRKNDYFGFVSSVIIHIIILLLLIFRQGIISGEKTSLSVTLLEEERKKEKVQEKKEEEKKREPELPKVKKKMDLYSALQKTIEKPPPLPMVNIPQKMDVPKIQMANLPKEPIPVLPIKGIEIKEVTKDIGPQAQIDLSSLEFDEAGIGGEIVVGQGVSTQEIMKRAVYQPSISIGTIAEGEGLASSSAGLPQGFTGSGGKGSGIQLGVKVEESEPPPVSPVKTTLVKNTPTIQKEKKVTFEVSGSIAGRKILYSSMPNFPSWAVERGLQAAITIKIYVTPEGNVKSSMIVFNTSGYPQWDELCKKALLNWKFAPLPPGSPTQDGYIIFRFILE